jgi:hypothetical protein
MKKKEKEFLKALEERFYKVGSFIDGAVFDPYVYKNEKGEAVEAIELTLAEANRLITEARKKSPVRYYHIFNDDDKWVEDNNISQNKKLRKQFWQLQSYKPK